MRTHITAIFLMLWIAVPLVIDASSTAALAAGNSGTTSSKLVSVTKKIILAAAKVGLEEAGSRLMGSAWPYLKAALSPVFDQLKERYPGFFAALSGSGSVTESEAARVADAISNDPALQKMIVDGFANLSAGQREIVNRIGELETVLVQQNESIMDLQKATDQKLDRLLSKVDALARDRPHVNYTEGITMFDLEGGWTIVAVAPPPIPECRFNRGDLRMLFKALDALRGTVSYIVPFSGVADLCWLRNNDVKVDLYGSMLRLQATGNWYLAREIDLSANRMVLWWRGAHGERDSWTLTRSP